MRENLTFPYRFLIIKKMNCEFQNPVNIGNEENPDFEFSKIVCDDETIELIEHGDAKFYVRKTLTYGEGLFLWFLTIFLIIFIGKILFDFFWKK